MGLFFELKTGLLGNVICLCITSDSRFYVLKELISGLQKFIISCERNIFLHFEKKYSKICKTFIFQTIFSIVLMFLRSFKNVVEFIGSCENR